MDNCEENPESNVDKHEEMLEQDLLVELQCPLCGSYMAPPIQQCIVGHNFCQECFDLIYLCSQCYSPKGTTRNHLLEKMYFKVNLPCKYAPNGCEFTAKSQNKLAHELKCSYTIRKCPFKFTSLCSWQGIIHDIEEHCYELHPYSVYRGPVVTKLFFGFEECFDGYSMFMIFAFNSLFRFTSCIDKESRMLKFATTYMGQQLTEDKYSFEIKFLRNGTERAAITLKAICAYLADHTKPFADPNYMVMPLDVLKPFCDCSGDLHYVVKIIVNNKEASSSLCIPSTSKAM